MRMQLNLHDVGRELLVIVAGFGFGALLVDVSHAPQWIIPIYAMLVLILDFEVMRSSSASEAKE